MLTLINRDDLNILCSSFYIRIRESYVTSLVLNIVAGLKADIRAQFHNIRIYDRHKFRCIYEKREIFLSVLHKETTFISQFLMLKPSSSRIPIYFLYLSCLIDSFCPVYNVNFGKCRADLPSHVKSRDWNWPQTTSYGQIELFYSRTISKVTYIQ